MFSLFLKLPRKPNTWIRNSILDLFFYKPVYNVRDYKGLSEIKKNFLMIRDEFKKVSQKSEKKFIHDLDPIFTKNYNYYTIECEQFHKTYELIKSISCVNPDISYFLVTEGPLYMVPQRAEFNHLLRYHMTIEGTGHSHVETEYGCFRHDEGEEFVFDYSRVHTMSKHDTSRRVVLCLNIKILSHDIINGSIE